MYKWCQIKEKLLKCNLIQEGIEIKENLVKYLNLE